MSSTASSGSSLLEALKTVALFYSVELRPPEAGVQGARSIEDWIDTYHSVRRLTAAGRPVFITDNAVGRPEEENLRHLVTNLGSEVDPQRIVPFLTSKHTLEYCLRYAERAYVEGFRNLVVLGGDRHDGVPRCVAHASELRGRIRGRVPGLVLGGWANPHADAAQQVRYLGADICHADFFLTQVVSHHAAAAVGRFVDEVRRREVPIPGVFGVFYYRSARRRTLEVLSEFFPVPVAALTREFDEEGLDADAVCARSVRFLHDLGIRHIYVSNLPVGDAFARLERIARLAAAE
jgi:5,10-methylenetetrahydrofolate reductase